MYSIWIQVNPTTWVEATHRFVEEQHAAAYAASLKGQLFDVRVFIQFDSEPDMQEVVYGFPPRNQQASKASNQCLPPKGTNHV